MEIKFSVAGPPIGGVNQELILIQMTQKKDVLKRWYSAVKPAQNILWNRWRHEH